MYIKQSAFSDFLKHEHCRKGKGNNTVWYVLIQVHERERKLSYAGEHNYMVVICVIFRKVKFKKKGNMTE